MLCPYIYHYYFILSSVSSYSLIALYCYYVKIWNRNILILISYILQRSTKPRRPITYFLYKGLTSKCLHEHLKRQHATNENITQALRQLQGLPSEYAEVYLKRNGKPHPFQNVFPDTTNISNNAVIPCDKYLDQTNPDFYRLFYGSQEFQCWYIERKRHQNKNVL